MVTAFSRRAIAAWCSAHPELGWYKLLSGRKAETNGLSWLDNRAGLFRNLLWMGFFCVFCLYSLFFFIPFSSISCFLKAKTCNTGNHNGMLFCVIFPPFLTHVTYLTKWPAKLMDKWHLLRCSTAVYEPDVFSITGNSSNTHVFQGIAATDQELNPTSKCLTWKSWLLFTGCLVFSFSWKKK